MISERHPLLKQLLVLVMIHCLAVTTLSAGRKARKPLRRVPTTIVFEPEEVSVEPGKSVKIKATVKDQRDVEMRNARIDWNMPAEAEGVISLSKPLKAADGNLVLLTGLKAPPSAGSPTDITIHATSGKAVADLMIHYQTTPSEISLTVEGDNNDLLPGVTRTISATVKDQGGNDLHGQKVSWKLADKKQSEFVFLGPATNNATRNSIDVVGLSGSGANKAPAEIPIIATVGAVPAVVTLNYKSAAAKGKSALIFAPTEMDILPNEEKPFSLTLKNAEGALVSDPKVEFTVAEEDKAFIRISGPTDGAYKVTGLGGDLKTASKTIRVTASAGGVTQLLLVRFVAGNVETDWDILPSNIVGDLYGRTIKSDYYCIEVTVQNNSGGDLSLSRLRFVRNGGGTEAFSRPTASYNTAHGSLQRRKLTHPRAMTLAIVDGLGTLMTGFNPFFHNINHAKNYSQFIDILSNPLRHGIEKGWMDSYPDELARFERDALQDGNIIHKDDTLKTKIFVSKRALFPDKTKPAPEDPDKIRTQLGRLEVSAYQFNRGASRVIAQ
jgi:hypothetical protein